MKKIITKICLAVGVAALLASCASTKNINLNEHSPTAIISITGTNLVAWLDSKQNDNDEDDNTDGVLNSMVNRAIGGKNPEIATAVDRLDYADDSFRHIVPEITGIEVLDKDKVVNSEIYKRTMGTFYNSLTDNAKGTNYKDMTVIGAKKARILMRELGVNSLVSMNFNFKKVLAKGTKQNGQAAAFVIMKIKVIDSKGRELINKEYTRRSTETAEITGGYYNKEELLDLINKTIDELITEFAHDYSDGTVLEKTEENQAENSEISDSGVSENLNVTPTKLGKPKSASKEQVAEQKTSEENVAEKAANQKAEETAKNLLKMNLSPEQIAEATGLSVERVKELQAEQNKNQ